MRIVFLPTTAPDFEWITEYYLSIFPEGGPNAYRRLDRALLNLSENPRPGKAIASSGSTLPRSTNAVFLDLQDRR